MIQIVTSSLQWLALALWSALCGSIACPLLLIPSERARALGAQIPGKIWAPFILWAGPANVQVIEHGKLDPERSYLFMMNHQSMMDIPIVYGVLGRPLAFLLKNALRKVPFIGWYCAAMGMMFVKRGDPKVNKQMRAFADGLEDGHSIMIYPEGGRAKSDQILPFKKGAAHLNAIVNCPVVPMAVAGVRDVLPSGSLKMNSAKCTLVIGDPIPYDPSLSVEEATERYQQAVEKLYDEATKIHDGQGVNIDADIDTKSQATQHQ